MTQLHYMIYCCALIGSTVCLDCHYFVQNLPLITDVYHLFYNVLLCAIFSPA